MLKDSRCAAWIETLKFAAIGNMLDQMPTAIPLISSHGTGRRLRGPRRLKNRVVDLANVDRTNACDERTSSGSHYASRS